MQKLLVIMFGLVLVWPAAALAQQNGNVPFSLPDELETEIIPNYPKPGEMVWINLSMYTADLDSADIAWYRNGKQELLGKGLKQYSFRNAESGKTTNIEIRVRLQNGTSFSKKLSFAPASIDLVWEADSYVPPFYQGKALHPRQGKVKVVAIPDFVLDGKRIKAEKLIYEWSDGLQVYQSQSGYGRNVLFLNGSILGSSEEVEVLVRDPESNLVAQAFLSIPTTDPEIVFYQNDSYYGFIFDQALRGQTELTSQEIEVFVSPLFITKELGSALQYNWRLNGQAVPELQGSRTAIFRKPENSAGQSNIRVEVKNDKKILQFADSSLTINFDK